MKRTKQIMLITLIPIAFIMLTSFPGSKKDHHNSNYNLPLGISIEDLTLNDGTYQGESIGFREGLIVEVTIEKGELTEIEIISHNEIGPQFFMRPIQIIPKTIKKEQETKVDSISGATATSMGIMSAVENALEKAKA